VDEHAVPTIRVVTKATGVAHRRDGMAATLSRGPVRDLADNDAFRRTVTQPGEGGHDPDSRRAHPVDTSARAGFDPGSLKR
jgi:hypothetical protein